MKTTTKIISTLAVVGVIAGAGFAAASPRHGGGPGSMMQGMFDRYDANADGKITQEELNAGREKQFKQYDKNGDGKLDLNEYQALWNDIMRERMVRAFQRYDADGDGKVTLDEYQKKFKQMVQRFDENHDGAFDMQDMKEKMERHRQHRD